MRDAPRSKVELLTLRFADAPSFFVVASGRGVCDQLRASGRSTAVVEYDVHGRLGELRGYSLRSIDGKPYRDEDPGVGMSGEECDGGPRQRHPLEDSLR